MAIITELLLGVATGFDLLLIGVIFIISGSIGLLVSSVPVALVLVTVLSILYVFVGRAFIKNKLAIQTRATNVDAVIGQKGIVVKKITSQTAGQVKVEGEIWRATSNKTIDEGEEIVVNSVSGVTLRVS